MLLTKGPGKRHPSCSRNQNARLTNPGSTAAVGDAQQIQSTPDDLNENSTNLGVDGDANRDSGFEWTMEPDCNVAAQQQSVPEDSQEEDSDA